MTDMRRVTISVPDTLDKRILELRKKQAFARCSYSEIIRRMVELGIQADQGNVNKSNARQS